jgi:hypothetical protein
MDALFRWEPSSYSRFYVLRKCIADAKYLLTFTIWKIFLQSSKTTENPNFREPNIFSDFCEFSRKCENYGHENVI